MLALLKKDMLVNSWLSYIGFVIFIIGLYVVALSPYFAFIVSSFGFIFSIFFTDEKYHVYRSLVSMPIKRNTIIYSRYLFCIFVILFILFIQALFMILFEPILSGSHFLYSWKDLIILFCLGNILISIFIPLIHLFSSSTGPSFFIFALFGGGSFFIFDQLVEVLNMTEVILFNELDAGFVLLVEKYIPFYPFLLLPLITGILLYISMIVSIHIFTKKDY